MSLTERVTLLTGDTAWALTPVPSVGLEPVVLSDGPIGVRGVDDVPEASAQMPAPSSMAATWNTELMADLGRLMASEARRKGVDVVLAPVVNLQRTPVGGRHFECLSEDPVLAGNLAVAFVQAIQAAGVGACIKHFIGNESETDRTTYTAHIDARTLREVYLAPFERVVRDAGVWTLMAAYNALDDGIESAPATQHRRLLTDILKEEWEFDGIVMSDWLATKTTVDSALAGLDLVMPGPAGPWGAELEAAVIDGRIPEDLVNDKVRRILRLAERVGRLSAGDQPGRVGVPVAGSKLLSASPDSAPTRALLREVAARGTVVLRNEGALLPLPASISSIALIGANAEKPFVQGGGSAHVVASIESSPIQALRDALPGCRVEFARGGRTLQNAPEVGATELERGSVDVSVLDTSGAELEHRTVPAPWDGFIRDLPKGASSIRVQAELVLAGAGLHDLEIAPVGAHRITVDGALVSESAHVVGAEVVLNSSHSHPLAHSVSITVTDDGATPPVMIDVEVQVVDAESFGRFARVALRHRAPSLSTELEMQEAERLASRSDVAIVVVGTTPETESEGWDRPTLEMPASQNELVRRVSAANPRTVVIVNAGAPLLLPWLDETAATVWWWLPGQEAGTSLADVLTGATEPSGRLPWTLPARSSDVPVPNAIPFNGVVVYAEGLNVGYRGWDAEDLVPAREFGFGLGYGSVDYLSAQVLASTGESIELEVVVQNTGDRTTRETVQVYLSAAGIQPIRPVRWLAAHGQLDLEPGATRTLQLQLPRRTFETWDDQLGRWELPAGTYIASVGRSSRDIRLRLNIIR